MEGSDVCNDAAGFCRLVLLKGVHFIGRLRLMAWPARLVHGRLIFVAYQNIISWTSLQL